MFDLPSIAPSVVYTAPYAQHSEQLEIVASMCAAGPLQDAFCLQPLTFLLDNQEHTVALAQWGEAAASQDSLRAAAMVNMSPIHSYLFSPDGDLLHANETAAAMINKSGTRLSLAECFGTAL